MANIGIDILGLPTTVGGLSGSEWVPIVQGGTTKRTQAANLGLASFILNFPAGIDYVIDGGSAALTTGTKGSGLQVPFSCSIAGWVLAGQGTGSIVVDVWRTTAALYDGGVTHPVVGDSITGTNIPTITAAGIAIGTVSGWTATSLNAGDWLWYHINSVATFQTVTLALGINRLTT